MRKYVTARVIAAIAAFLLGLLIVGPVVNDDPAPTGPVTAKVDGADRDRDRDQTITAPRKLVEQAARSGVAGHVGSRNEAPDSPLSLEARDREVQKDYTRKQLPPLPTAGATQTVPGCRTVFVRNQSSRNGVRPQLFTVHYTVSANRPGLADMNAVTTLANSSRAQVSWHFLIDREGHCYYSVPIENKAWTGAALNPHAIQAEVINTGGERPFMDTPGYAKLVQVIRYSARRANFPIRRGAVSNCSPTRSGIIQHADGGYCAGGHTDIRPFDLGHIIALSAKGKVGSRFDVLTKAERKPVSRTCYHRGKRDHQPKRSTGWLEQNSHAAAWRRQVKANYTRLHSPWRLRNRGTRRKLQADVYVNRRGSCQG